MRKKRLYFILFGLGVLTMLGVAAFSRLSAMSPAQVAAQTSGILSQKADSCRQAIERAFVNYKENGTWDQSDFENHGIGLYLFRNDSLVYWNNSQWAVNEKPAAFAQSQGLAPLGYGSFLYVKTVKDHVTGIALSLVKPLYSLQNNYLSNSASSWLRIPHDMETDTSRTGANPVKLGGETLFTLTGSEPGYYLPDNDAFCLVLFIVAFLFTLASLLLICRTGISGPLFFVLLALAPAGRALMLAYKWPAFLYRSLLYDPRLFGNAQSSMNGFLGDILFNALVFLFMALALHFYFAQKGSRLRHYVALASFAVLAFVLFNQFNKIIISLVNNSTFNFNFLSIFTIRPAVFIALATAGILSAALFVCINRLALLCGNGFRGILLFAAIILAACILQQLVSPAVNYPESYWLLIYAALIFAGSVRGQGVALALGLHVLVISVVSSSFLNFYIGKNQALDLEILMHDLGERQDGILENEFAGLSKKIKEDETLGNLVELLPESEKELVQKLKQKYFGGYFDRYKIDFMLFDKNCKPLLPAENAVLLNEGFFEDQVKYYSQPAGEDLYFVKGHEKNTRYISTISLGTYNLYALLEARQLEEVGSFPDLFLDQSLQRHDKLRSFSYAVYRAGQNANRYGDFNYPYFFQDSLTLAQSAPGYIHYYFAPAPDTRIVISQEAKSWKYLFTFNSYLLLFYSLLTYGCYLFYALVFTGQFSGSSLTRRVQTIIILLLLLAMSAVGITSGYLVTGQFEAENRKELEEKTRVIVSDLTGQLSPTQLFDESQKELLNARLRDYSHLFNTPISLFNKNGILFTTSEPKLYDFGLAATYANPLAYNALRNNLTSAVCVTEKAGTLNYLSLYTPLFNQGKTPAGFINLPYFARQGDLTNELSEIISALINVYVILFVLSILAGLILSGYITQPLRMIKQQLAKITLGTQNEKISWQSNDEIGKLVTEYNLMLLKLEESASLLARSERESAWREMAKQVAHEIKNPLTPMKLNLQYLQHLIKHNPEDFKERFERASAGIIEQIDALATIATEFSNFAKLPSASLQTINLAELIGSAVHVFENSRNVQISNRVSASSLPVEGDREQCLRVFNNILKNAVQATEEVPGAEIIISAEEREGRVVVAISDNGSGIGEDLKPKIFSPNFTTKSTGSGLGLGMVKNIMEGFGGQIWFESEKDSGTTFFLEFKAAGPA